MKKRNIQNQKLVDQYSERLIKTIKLDKYNKINSLYEKIFNTWKKGNRSSAVSRQG